MSNELFPVFIRMEKQQLLIVGAGEVGFEKVGFMFRHCTNANLTIVAPYINPEILKLKDQYPDQFTIYQREFIPTDFEGKDLAIAATADKELNKHVWEVAKQYGVLINVADTPDLCDFYLSSVVKKGDLKVAISSNGKSPTLTKRMRELLTDILPEEVDELLQNLSTIRDQMKGDFEEKVIKLNEITKSLTEN